MDAVECGHCRGTGKEWANISLDTGEVEYRTCSVCNGTGSVAPDKSYFTKYPDLSLQKALQLMQRHGKPAEVCIAGNHDIRVLFEDGSRYTLGGFTVGYRGTGPDYTKQLLDAAGFNVSIDEIAKMEPPVTLVAGQPYIAPQTLVFHAPTVEEARRKAVLSVPPGSKIFSLEVVLDGIRLMHAEGDGSSEDIAFEAAKRKLPAGATIERKEIRDELQTEFYQEYRWGAGKMSLEGEGDSENAAFEDGKSKLPERLRAAAEKEKTLQAASQGKLTAKAYTEAQAKKDALNKLPRGAVITSVSCTRQPRHGLVMPWSSGEGTYEVTWRSPWIVQLKVRAKKVTLTYRPLATVEARFQP